MQPFGKYLLVKEEKKEDKVVNGVIVEIGALQNKDEVTVVAVGDAVTKCSIGDRLLVNKRRFVNEVKDSEGKPLKFIYEDDCYAKL